MTGDAELANARAFWLGYGIEYRDDAAVAVYRSGVRSPSLNGILRVSDDDVDGVLKQARRRLDGVPWMWWAGPDSPLGTAERLLARGAAEVGQQSIMAAPTDRLAAPEAPAGFYSLATTPEFRRRGVGAAMMGAALRAAREWSVGLATLQATAQGEPLYTRMGFERVGEYRLFTLPAAS